MMIKAITIRMHVTRFHDEWQPDQSRMFL